METELIKELNGVLKAFPQFWDSEELHRSMVIDAINQKEPNLIKALISNDKIKSLYSTDMDGVLLFDFEKLTSFLKYKKFWNDNFTKYRNTVGLTSEGKYLKDNSDVVLDFPFKDCVLEGGMTKEDQGKEEIYYNEVIARDEIDRLFSPKVLTNIKRYTADGIEENITDFSDEDNLIIKGNNLIALHSLKERYIGKVKLIYIDPPYNTGNDGFKYNDRFNRSTWLTFMKNRLEIAKELLSDDGWILIHIDDIEFAYLKVLCDSIFGEENFNNAITIQDSHASGLKLAHKDKSIIKTKSYILVYKKSELSRIQPSYIERYDWDRHFNRILIKTDQGVDSVNLVDYFKKITNHFDFKISENSLRDPIFYDFIEKNKDLIVQSTKEIPQNIKDISLQEKDTVIEYQDSNDNSSYAYNGRRLSPLNRSFWNISLGQTPNYKFAKLLCDVWTHIDFNNSQNEGNVSFPTGKKPEKLIATIIHMFSQPNQIVMDFHLGSGTTAAVAHKMGRRYIGIEQMDYINEITVPRLQKVIEGEQGGISKDVEWQGGGSFVYVEMMELNYQFIHKIDNANDYESLKVIFEEMKEKAHLNYQADLNKVLQAHYEMDGIPRKVCFDELELHEQKKLLIELLDKNQLYVSYSEIKDRTLNVSETDQTFNHSFYEKD